jgi:hypothetical protein
MTTPVWQSGKLYLPGDLVQPATAAAPVSTEIPNAGFEGGDIGWTKGAGWAIGAIPGSFQGANCAQCSGGAHSSYIESTTDFPVTPGQSITLSGATNGGHDTGNGCALVLAWYDASLVLISRSEGAATRGSEGHWESGSFAATAPARAAFVRPGARANVTGAGHFASVDSLSWNYTVPSEVQGLIYKAVQPEAGVSASTEPDWPPVLGQQVIDNEVIWEAVQTSRVVWQASPSLRSGATEPDWPTSPGSLIVDGTIAWECVSRRIEDENCPNTKVVAILAAKVFAVDRDIVRYSATANPLDWTTTQDAGYLPTGLQQANANDMAVLNQYRGNLVAFNASSFQNWQADPDPAAMAILDQMDGIGSTWQRAAQPVGNELFYLSQLGVRSVGIANAAENLAAGDVGAPIDPLAQEALRVAAANGIVPRATYYPGAGQYWLALTGYPAAPLMITGDLPDCDVNTAIAPFTYVASGGVLPLGDFSIASGALPSGLSLASDGRITGTPIEAGMFAWTVQVADADGTIATLSDANEVFSDPLWANVISLMHFQGAPGSTEFNDELTPVWSVVQASATLTDTSPIFGETSALFLGDKLRSGIVSTAPTGITGGLFGNDASDVGDFCVEFFCVPDAVVGGTDTAKTFTAFSPDNPSSGADFNIQIYGGQWRVWMTATGTSLIAPAGSASVGQQQHVALTRSAGVARLYIDGVMVGSAAYTHADGNVGFKWGEKSNGNQTNGEQGFKGRIAEGRITKGAARYTSNFTPPSRMFPNG